MYVFTLGKSAIFNHCLVAMMRRHQILAIEIIYSIAVPSPAVKGFSGQTLYFFEKGAHIIRKLRIKDNPATL